MAKNRIKRLSRSQFNNLDHHSIRDQLKRAGFDRSAAAVVREKANVEQFSDHEPVFTKNEYEPLIEYVESW